jgi:sRNA-binding regulator protein Hfq
VLNSDLFITFFLNAQKETQIEVEKNAEMTIYLMNFEKIILEIESFDVTEDVLIVNFWHAIIIY